MKKLSNSGAFTLLAIASLTIMVGCVIVPGLTEISENLKAANVAGWLVTLPSLGVVLFGPVAACIIQRWGAYKSISVGLVLYGLLGAAGVFLDQLVILFADRILLGGVTAVVMASGTALISSFYEGPERLKMIAVQGMSIELGGVIFLSLGGLLASISWQWPFALYLIAWLFALMLFVFVPRPEEKAGGKEDKADVSDKKGPKKAMMMVYWAAMFSMITFFVAVIFLPRHLSRFGLNTSQIGFFMSFMSLMAVAAASQMPRFIRWLNDFGTLCFAFGSYIAANIMFYFSVNIYMAIAGAVFTGFGFGLSIPLVNHMTIEISAPELRGRNLAYLSVAVFGGQFLSSFMEFLGNGELPFIGAACLSVVMVVSITVFCRSRD